MSETLARPAARPGPPHPAARPVPARSGKSPPLPQPSVLLLLLLLVAPAAGSFLNVLIDRLPRGEDVVRAPSACRACGRRLGLRDLVPVLSFAATRGRCRHCGAPIPAWHLHVEIATPGLALLAVLAGGGPAVAWLTAGVLWCLLALAVSDLLWLRLPDPLTLALLVLALALALADPGRDPGQALLGAGLGAGTFWLLRQGYARLRGREGLGLGDVKLMAGIGALAGPAALPATVLTGALLALAATGLARRPLRGATALPFGAALCAAAGLAWLWRAGGF